MNLLLKLRQKKQSHHPKIAPFIAYLEGLTVRPQANELREKMEKLNITQEDLNKHIQFHKSRYLRNLIFESKHVQLLCLCWKYKQSSPIHDHAESICAVKVITGIATETTYQIDPTGIIKPVATTEYPPGVFVSEDADIHNVSNHHEQNLITLHCYSPPLKKMKKYYPQSKNSKIYEPRNSQNPK